MAKWQRKILLNPEWDQAQDKAITTQKLAASIAVKLRSLAPFLGDDIDHLNDERDVIADAFEELAEDHAASERDFNSLMHDFYEWADSPLDGKWNGAKACWIDTMSEVEAA